MKNWIKTLLVAGWFFVFQSAGDVPGSFMTTVVGPFATEAVCKAKFAEIEDMIEAFGAGEQVKLTKCLERVEA